MAWCLESHPLRCCFMGWCPIVLPTLPSGRHTKNYWSHGPAEIVELPSYKMLDFPSYKMLRLGQVWIPWSPPLSNTPRAPSLHSAPGAADSHRKLDWFSEGKIGTGNHRFSHFQIMGLSGEDFPKKTNPLTISETIPTSFRKALKINRKASGQHTRNYGKSLQN